MITAVTVVAGRHDHLRLQLAGLRAGTVQPDRHVVVSMGDPEIDTVCDGAATVVPMARTTEELPVAAARNLGARTALAAGADTVVFLDVDCVPSPGLIARYGEVARSTGKDALLSGTVVYLPPPPPGGYRLAELPGPTEPHPVRPAPAEDEVVPMDHRLFWSLSFALTPATWSRIGGFCERYVGYGAEDTDFAETARTAGVEHLAVGGAAAWHQWHPSPDPPLNHFADIVRNARIFRERKGWWPMGGWLAAFENLGLLRYDHDRDDWVELTP